MYLRGMFDESIDFFEVHTGDNQSIKFGEGAMEK